MFIIFPLFADNDTFEQVFQIVQLFMSLTVTGSIIYTYFIPNLNILKYMLFLQAIQMQLSNFNMYKEHKESDEEGEKVFLNYEGLNQLSTVFSVIFSFCNSMLMGFVFPNQKKLKNGLIVIIFVFQTFSILYTTFIFENMSYHSIIALVIAIVFTSVMIPVFGLITDSIINESIEE